MNDSLFEAVRTDTVEDAFKTYKRGPVSLDIETTGLDPRKAKIRTIQIAHHGGAYVIDTWDEEITPERLAMLRMLFNNGDVTVLQNAKFDLQFLKYHYGLDVSPVFDTMIAGQVLRDAGSYGLDSMVDYYLNTVLPKDEQSSDWSRPLTQKQVNYARRDAEILLPLRAVMIEELNQSEQAAIARIEFEAIPSVVQMELAGVKVDLDKLTELRLKTQKERHEAHLEFEMALPDNEPTQLSLEGGVAPRLNLRSPQQVTAAFNRVGLYPEDTKEKTLKAIDHPMATALLKHRKRSKWLGSFLETYPDMIHPVTGRIHASFKQCTVVTGRMACASPNLQQVPKDEEFRSLFVAEAGNVLVTADYAGQEMRVLAELSGEPVLLRALHEDPESDAGDIHKIAASYLFGKPVEEVTKEERTRAKTLQFGLVYGRGGAAFAQDMQIAEDKAWEMIDDYFSAYPKVKSWMTRQRARAEQDGYVRTILGRKIPLNMEDETKSWKREAINYPIQGSSADMVKIAMAEVHEVLPDYTDSGAIVNAVHDELVIEVPEKDAKTVAKVVYQLMKGAGAQVLDRVPVEVEVGWAKQWRK